MVKDGRIDFKNDHAAAVFRQVAPNTNLDEVLLDLKMFTIYREISEQQQGVVRLQRESSLLSLKDFSTK